MSRRLTALLAAATLVPLAGCGDSGSPSSGPGADPAKVVPADVPVYVEAVVRPDGSVGDGARDALKKLLRTDDPGAKITGLLDKKLAKDGLSWDKIKEWLDKRVAVFVTGKASGATDWALVLAVTDAEKANADLQAAEKKNPTGKIRTSEYKGVKLTLDDDGGFAQFGDYVVGGKESAVKAAIDTFKGGRPLTDVADYNAARAAVKADDALGMAYLDPQGLVDLISNATQPATDSVVPNPFGNQQAIGLLRQIFAQIGRAAGVSLHASGDAIRIDGAGLGASGTGSTTSADNVAALPGDAWLALGFGDLGKSITKALGQLSQLSSAAGAGSSFDFGGMLKGIESKTGINLKRDFLSWMGDGALYARGHSLADIGVVLTIKSKNGAKSRRAVGLLARAIKRSGGQSRTATVEGYDTALQVRLSQRVPISVYVAANANRFSVGINPQALTDVLNPAKTFGDSPTYAAATKALGGDLHPVFVLDFPTVVNFLEGLGVGNNPGFAKVKPYLDALGTLSVGTARDGDVARFALALGLR